MESYFKDTDLMSFDQLNDYWQMTFGRDKALCVAPTIKKYCFLSDGCMYILKKYNIFSRVLTNKKIRLTNLIERLLHESCNNLRPSEEKVLGSCKQFQRAVHIRSIETFVDVVLEMIETEKEVDKYKSQVHFRNGYIDLETMTLKPRSIEDYITTYIDRDYVESSSKAKEEIYDILKKIYPKEEDFNTVMKVICSAFSGYSEIDRTSLFLLGVSSAGKSLIMKLLREAFTVYVKEFDSNTFEAKNKNKDKMLNELIKCPNIRIAWVNEMSDCKTDMSLFKKFCEGVIQTCSLYKDGINTIEHKAKVIHTSNDMPNLKIDTGSDSRIIAYNHMSTFVDNDKEVNEKKFIFKKDKQLLDRVRNNEDYLNAIVDIACGYCHEWMKHGMPTKLPDRFGESKDVLVSSNDVIRDFIDSKLTITNETTDRIGKDEMRRAFLDMYPDKRLTVQQVISSMKDKGINYSCDYRVNKMKGCFYGVKFSDETEHQSMIGIIEENERLKAQVAELRAEVEKLKTKKTEKESDLELIFQ